MFTSNTTNLCLPSVYHRVRMVLLAFTQYAENPAGFEAAFAMIKIGSACRIRTYGAFTPYGLATHYHRPLGQCTIYLVGAEGLEPSPAGLKDQCATLTLHSNKLWRWVCSPVVFDATSVSSNTVTTLSSRKFIRQLSNPICTSQQILRQLGNAHWSMRHMSRLCATPE